MSKRGEVNGDQATPFRTEMASEAFYAELDRGIRFPVRVLHAAGIATCQSCEGGEGHAYEGPTVDLPEWGPSDATGFAALDALNKYGLAVYSVAVVWNIERGLPHESLWRVVLRQPCPERADEMPIFVHGYKAGGASDA